MIRADCVGKRRYSAYGEASKGATSLYRNTGNRCHPYACHLCGGFHVGHPIRLTVRKPIPRERQSFRQTWGASMSEGD